MVTILFASRSYNSFRKKIDELLSTSSSKKSSESSTFGSAFAKFKSMDDCGLNDSKSADSKISGHKNTIR